MNYYRFGFNGKNYRLDLKRFSVFCITVMLIWTVAACILINHRCAQNVAYYTYEPLEKSDPIDFTEYKKAAAEMPVASTSSVKRYMDRSAVTDTSTQNYKICHKAKVCEDGTLEYEGRKVIAIGQAYGTPGDKLDITLQRKNGEEYVLKAVIGDAKKYADTKNGEGFCGKDGHVIEMIVDTEVISPVSKEMGDMNYTPSVEGDVVSISRAVI